MARRPPARPATDRLYQVPLSEFIAERDALAKAAGPQRAEIRRIQKPTLPAWAVNQLYWRSRSTYEELLQRAADLRATHDAALGGQPADLRGAGRAHEDALARALKGTLALLAEGGHPVTDATRQAIATTLRGLPSEEPPGQLTRPLEARGFDMLAGAGLGSGGQVRAAGTPPPRRPAARERQKQDTKGAARLAAVREAAAAAAREVKEAEGLARRQEFEAARTAREAEKASRKVEDAEATVREAQEALEEATRTAAEAIRARDAAQAGADRASAALEAARRREQAARERLETLA